MRGATPEFPADLPVIQWRKLILAALLALIFHALFLLPRIPTFWLTPALAPPRVDIKQVDPRKLEEIRRQWSEKDKSLLMDKTAPPAKEADKNARYMSDRNIRVEKEQKAKRHIVVPKEGAPGDQTDSREARPRQAPAQPKTRDARKLPNLGNLGVPLPKAPKKQPTLADQDSKRAAPAAKASGQQGGEQYINDPNVAVGSENLLNAQESIYYSFYARLYEAIGPVWQSKIRQAARLRRLQPGEYSTQLDVVFDKDGNLVAVNQSAPSGIAEFDQAADAAWKSIGRFPNPPQGLLDEQGQVHTGWTFTVQITQGFGMESLPPERVY